jgi:hypothetical protein
MNPSGGSGFNARSGMLESVIDRFFQSLLAMIVFAGSAHTIASFYREKEKRRRWRETVRRLKLEDSNAPG